MLNNYGQIVPDDWEVGQLWVGKGDQYSYKLVCKEGSNDGEQAKLRFVWLDKDRFHCRITSFLLREKYSFDQWINENEYVCTLDRRFAVDLKESMEQLT